MWHLAEGAAGPQCLCKSACNSGVVCFREPSLPVLFLLTTRGEGRLSLTPGWPLEDVKRQSRPLPSGCREKGSSTAFSDVHSLLEKQPLGSAGQLRAA